MNTIIPKECVVLSAGPDTLGEASKEINRKIADAIKQGFTPVGPAQFNSTENSGTGVTNTRIIITMARY
jgi:hypothetical protein